jgi:hypothetical protein
MTLSSRQDIIVIIDVLDVIMWQENAFLGAFVRAYEKCTSPRGGGQIVFFNWLDVYHTPPHSGERQYKSRWFDPAGQRAFGGVRACLREVRGPDRTQKST